MGCLDRARKGHIQRWLPTPTVLKGSEYSQPSQGTAVRRKITKLNSQVRAWDQLKPALPLAPFSSARKANFAFPPPPTPALGATAFGSSVGIGLVKLQVCSQLTQNIKVHGKRTGEWAIFFLILFLIFKSISVAYHGARNITNVNGVFIDP